MPAKHTQRINKENSYFHISNKGVSGKAIFLDPEDYQTFLSFLQEYLSPLAQSDGHRKDFIIRGRRFQGIPHLPKNYFGNIYLIAYNLMPNHFHLLLYQTTKGSLEKFMRSLTTRYSMYFNKRYQCTGPLFEGPYKSIYIDGVSPALYLTRYLHRDPEMDGKHLTNKYSSYAEYLGKRQTLWIKPDIILAFFNNPSSETFRKIGSYKNFVDKYEINEKEKKSLEGILLEKEYEHLVGCSPQLASSNPSINTQVNQAVKPRLRFPEFAVATAGFILLFSLGYRNIVISSSSKTDSNGIVYQQTISSPSPAPSVAGTEDEKNKTMLVVKTDNGQESINIRQGPTIQSEIVGKAKNGDAFEFVSIDSGWYGVKLSDGSTGFIYSKYTEIIEEAGI